MFSMSRPGHHRDVLRPFSEVEYKEVVGDNYICSSLTQNGTLNIEKHSQFSGSDGCKEDRDLRSLDMSSQIKVKPM